MMTVMKYHKEQLGVRTQHDAWTARLQYHYLILVTVTCIYLPLGPESTGVGGQFETIHAAQQRL